MRPSRKWTPDLDMALREAWAGPLKAADIAREIGVASKNVVIGRAHRLGLPPRQPEFYRARRRRRGTPP